MNKYFVLFSTVYLVKGINRSIILDTKNNMFFHIPNYITKLFKESNVINYTKIDNIEWKDYMHLFISNKLGFITNEKDYFIRKIRKFELPYIITNLVLDVDYDFDYDYSNLCRQMKSINCPALQIRFRKNVELLQFNLFLEALNNTSLIFIEIFVDNISNNLKETCSFLEKFDKVKKVCFYSFTENLSIKNEKYSFDIVAEINNISPIGSEDIINFSHFETNISLFSESLEYNIGLNGKVYIAKNGDVKNYSSHKKVFGNINHEDLTEIIKIREFKEKWFINNDNIEICRDCEYRYICNNTSDIEFKNNKNFKKTKCNYNPFNNTWVEL